MKKWICGLMAVAMLLGVAACSTGGDTTTTTAPPSGGDTTTTEAASTTTAPDTTAPDTGSAQKLVYGVVAEPQGFDPGNSGETYAIPVMVNCFVGLAKIAEDGTTEHAAAESWDISDDGMVYTFHLRKDMKWSDGTPLTAHDFVYSFKRMADPALASTSASTTFHIVGGEEYFNGEGSADDMMVVDLDNDTLEITLKYPPSQFIEMVRSYNMVSFKREAVGAGGEAWPRAVHTCGSQRRFAVTSCGFGKVL